MFGDWTFDVHVGENLPQKLATAFAGLNETLLGADYAPIAYLGTQEVNGINHAVLAEQTVLTGKDTKNVVVLIFNEKPNATDVALVNIDRIVESGAVMGGVVVDAKTELPADAKVAWDDAFDGFVGSDIEPIALLGTQLVNGTNYIFAAKVTPVVPDADTNVVVITINNKAKTVGITDMMATKYTATLGYAFTWLKQ